MAMSTGGAGALNSEPNVTPMIDVLLVLLIIFMVVIAMGRTAVEITIPPPDTATRNTQQSDQIVLELRDDGTFWINGTQYSKNTLGPSIQQIFQDRPAKLMFIKPGQNRIYADVINAVDVARGSGVEVIGVTPIEAN
ncbi:MAG TPA: biopolymer transporter ExbD [Gemmatimonadales bacterium]|jgi:biopolymer transport protein ExbD